MPPSPSPHGLSFQDHLRFGRNRRQRTANPTYNPAHDISPTQAQSQARVAPLIDEGAGQVEDVSNEDEEEDIESGDLEEEEVDQEEEEGEEEEGDEEDGGIEEVPMEIDPPFDPAALGMKEIGNLASWTVSSCKPGCSVQALRDEDTSLFWQSDGPQPHHLNIHFSRLVSILSIRIFLDFEADESYTPTRISLLAGTGYHDLIPFAQLDFAQPKGWIDVDLQHVGGGEDGHTLRAFLVQVKILENHQNGKDTHVRGLKIYSRDERMGRGGMGMGMVNGNVDKGDGKEVAEKRTITGERGWLQEPDWMREVELR